MNCKFFTLDELVKANNIAKKRNYNRQLIDDFEKEILSEYTRDVVFPITFTMLHEHAQGYKVDPHVRCMIGVPGGTAFIDCDIDIFNNLSTTEVNA